MQWPTKDPDDVLDYGLNWTEWLDGDTLNSVVWTVLEGSIVKQSENVVGNVATVWFSGGVSKENCRVQCRITTVGGRTKDQVVGLRVR